MEQKNFIHIIISYIPTLTTPSPALITPFTVKIFANIETSKVANSIPRNPPSCFSISCGSVSQTLPISSPGL